MGKENRNPGNLSVINGLDSRLRGNDVTNWRSFTLKFTLDLPSVTDPKPHPSPLRKQGSKKRRFGHFPPRAKAPPGRENQKNRVVMARSAPRGPKPSPRFMIDCFATSGTGFAMTLLFLLIFPTTQGLPSLSPGFPLARE